MVHSGWTLPAFLPHLHVPLPSYTGRLSSWELLWGTILAFTSVPLSSSATNNLHDTLPSFSTELNCFPSKSFFVFYHMSSQDMVLTLWILRSSQSIPISALITQCYNHLPTSIFPTRLIYYMRASVSHLVIYNSATPWTVALQVPLSMDSPGKDTGVGIHSILQLISLTHGSNPCLLHCRQIIYCLSHQERSWEQRPCHTRSLQSCPTMCPYGL